MARSRSGPFSAATRELATVRDWLRFAVSRFEDAKLVYGHGTTNPYDEAAFLVLRGLGLPLERLEPFLDARLTLGERKSLAALLDRRVTERVPAPYLLREAWLCDHRFYVDERTIVPRSHLGELLRDALAPWLANPDAVRTVLDLCTGSGSLAVLAASVFPSATIDASDVSAGALAVARKNVDDYGLADQIRLVQSDLFAALSDARYDLILCNPPYVPDSAMRRLPREHRHEPRKALAGGSDGLDIIRRLLAQAPTHLSAQGLLVVEVGAGRPTLEEAFPNLPVTWLSTSAGDDLVFLLRRQDTTLFSAPRSAHARD